MEKSGEFGEFGEFVDGDVEIEALSGSWDATRAARDALVGRGAAVVGPVLDVLCDEGSPVEWQVAADVLCRIGGPALLPLAEAVAGAGSPEAGRRAGWALARLEVRDMSAFVPLLSHEHARVRDIALGAFQSRGEPALAFTDDLVPLLADPDRDVRRRAVWTFQAVGAAAVPVLRRTRRAPAPGPRLRAGALEALAAVGGPGVLDRRDREALRRLTRVKRGTEVPRGLHLCGFWYAVPTADQGAVLDAFALGDGEPVTLRTGAAAWNHDRHQRWRGGPHAGCARVFVSPVLDGWTLVLGHSSADAHRIEEADEERRDEVRARVVRERCAALSRRFGAAHWYGMSCGDGWTAWCLAEGGDVLRHYDVFDAERHGDEEPGHPAESGYLLPHRRGFPDDAFDDVDLSDFDAYLAAYRRKKDELGIPDTCRAVDIAARTSVDPASIGPRTRLTGQGVLALTDCGREHGHPAGALPF